LRQFHNQCVQCLRNIDRSRTKEQYKELADAYKAFTGIYYAEHTKAQRCEKPHGWGWVSAHFHAGTGGATLSVTESQYLNHLLEAALPTGVAVSTSAVADAEHLECVIGTTEQESITNFRGEAQWWLDHITGCTDQAQYYHYKQGYEQLIANYEEHHVHVSTVAAACPSWTEVYESH